jgi:predicted nucleic-acid-binding protein
MRFIDTHILLRYLTRDDEEKASCCLDLLKRVEKNSEKAITSPIVLFETIFTLESYYGIPRSELREMVTPIVDLRGLKLDMKEVFLEALDLYASTNLPFADCFNASFMRVNGIKELYSYDRDFDRLAGVLRIEP